jgi:hypothetical protein
MTVGVYTERSVEGNPPADRTFAQGKPGGTEREPAKAQFPIRDAA